MTGERIVVLLVDDQRFVGAALSRLLAGESDIELHCCHEPLDAMARANQLKPALILQDLVMPDVDGVTLVGMFRSNPATATTPIVVLSGGDEESARTRAEAAGANGYLVKLPSKEVLGAAIRDHAGDRAASTPATAAAPAGQVLDRAVLGAMGLSLGDAVPDFALELIDQFSDEADLRVKGLQIALECDDMAALKAHAHSLKGSSLVMGANRLAALCSRLEAHVARHPDGQGASAVIAAFSEELAQLRQAFADFRQDTR